MPYYSIATNRWHCCALINLSALFDKEKYYFTRWLPSGLVSLLLPQLKALDKIQSKTERLAALFLILESIYSWRGFAVRAAGDAAGQTWTPSASLKPGVGERSADDFKWNEAEDARCPCVWIPNLFMTSKTGFLFYWILFAVNTRLLV